MKELELKYGCNPNQKPASIYMKDGSELPLKVLSGRPGYINFLDALNSWQLVKELKEATGLPSAASFKHVSPAGAAVGYPLTDVEKKIYFVKEDAELSPIACAYIRARGTDRLSSYGDFAALSDVCDAAVAEYLKAEVSDGIIAPGYTPEALEILKTKKKGNYNVIEIDPDYVPAAQECKDVFGITFEQGHNNFKIDASLLENIVTANKELPDAAKIDMIVSLITLKYTQSNSVCYVKNGQAIGVGAGQQSRIHCTRLAGQKADNWWLRQNPKVLALPFKDGVRRADRDNAIDVYISDEYEDVLRDGEWQKVFTEQPAPLTREEKKEWIAKQSGLTVGSDAFFPFGDNVERARKSGAAYIAEPGGSIRDDNVIETADKYNIVMCFTGMRLFHH
ncbi:MAG: phosphoribosylaminoimidazolecarboxamide formyltransferase [Solobacterium sp.]|nr:phosphoribosylaminoimidazolecarboxamide formyltransferase [Solobacterium sp.]MBQ6532529.1 phosphoribosylaminoimidazolecarboxamide formyltransferase [Solobacterium sp.]